MQRNLSKVTVNRRQYKIFQAVRLNQLFLSRIRELEKQHSAKPIFFTHSFELMSIQRLGAAETSRTSDNCSVRLRTLFASPNVVSH